MIMTAVFFAALINFFHFNIILGWEKAENEVVALKQQLDSAVQENSVLEDRVSHLDGALKELVRQLRQAREEQEQKIQEALVKKTREW